MAKAERVELIKEIEKHRSSIVLTYITSTRANLEVQMAMDSIRRFYEHLILIPEKDKAKVKVDLFIVSNGGDGIVPWRLVTLIREFAHKFNVLIPHRAFSAATLTALGANKIFMHPMGMLGPTDPTVANHFNPDDLKNPLGKMGISVEDVSAYISFIKDDFGIRHEDELIEALKALTDKIHPLSLGNVKRSISQSKMMAKKLLSQHMDKTKDIHKIDEIVENLTSKLYYHGHPINRVEAKNEIGLNIEDADVKLEEMMWKLFLEYENEIKGEEAFNPQLEFIEKNPDLPINTPANYSSTNKLAFIESKLRTDYVKMDLDIWGVKQPNGVYQVIPNNVISNKWYIE